MRKLLLVLLSGMFLNCAYAEKSISIKEGVDYIVINTPVSPTPEPAGKINVKEFFSFVCIHCKTLDPLIENTIAVNKNVDFNKIQVVWDENSANLGRLNATLQVLKLHRLYLPIFDAIFARQDLSNLETLKALLTKNGLTAKEVAGFMDTYNSFTVSAKVNEYKKLTAVYNITATPTFIVGDHYIVQPAQPERLANVVQELVKQYKSLVKIKK
jgi:thiol:disulfide interchange protein DsbA